MAKWARFPHADKAYAYDDAALKKAWDRLHRGDCEAYPKDAASQEAWRLYHAGEFEKAVAAGQAAETASGMNCAMKAQAIYATYLEKADAKRKKLFEEAMGWAEEAMASHPKDANAHYFFALAAGRYSQTISIATALKQGLGGKVKAALEQSIKLQPKHADAHIAFGTWHAEIIGKVGAMVGGLTYGAKKDAAVEHFQKALKLNPDSAIARMEYANGLVTMFGQDRMKEAEKLYAEAVKVKPADAMERLDVEMAKSEMED
jgi:tetratricopeptide (TPR) repeat protein